MRSVFWDWKDLVRSFDLRRGRRKTRGWSCLDRLQHLRASSNQQDYYPSRQWPWRAFWWSHLQRCLSHRRYVVRGRRRETSHWWRSWNFLCYGPAKLLTALCSAVQVVWSEDDRALGLYPRDKRLANRQLEETSAVNEQGWTLNSRRRAARSWR